MKPVNIKYLNIFLLSLFIVSCSKENTDIEPNPYIKIGDEVSLNTLYNVQFFAEDSLFVGYNKVYFKITEKSTGQFISQAVISLHPLMDMGTFKHACPFENPAENSDSDGYFGGAILFSMPGSDNSWSLSADIMVDGETHIASFPISKVVGTNPVKKIVVIDSLSTGDGWTITKHPVSIVEPAAWKVGNNPFEITIHTMASMMSFPCCGEMTVEIIPEMPSMGHGSPNNVNPVLTTNGHYAGTVNFTMTGAWRINMIFRKGDRVIGRNAYFDINF